MTGNWVEFRIVCAAGWLVGAEAVAQGLPGSLQHCVAEQDSVQRLACFDRESARLMQQSEAGASTIASAAMASTVSSPTPTAKSRTDEENFGFSGSKLAREEAAQNPGLEQLTATITQVKTRPRGEFVVTLSNGQEWAQKEEEKPMSLSVGDQVTIKPGALGSYFLKGAKRAATRVTRVK